MRFQFKFFIICILILLMTTPVPAFETSGKATLLMDANSGRILFQDNPDEQVGVASISKLMTLVLALEALERGEVSLSDEVTASPLAASKRGTRIWLEAGETLDFQELLYAVAVGSANDAAVAIAEFIAGSEQGFVDLMNRRAKELGLNSTKFINSNGLSESDDSYNVMSALDVANLAMHAMQVPKLMSFVSTYEYTMRADTTKIPVLWNANRLLRRYYGVDGLKTGYTKEAGYCVVATAERDKLRLIGVILGQKTDADREKQARDLLDMGFRKYQSLQFYEKGTVVADVVCQNGEPRKVNVVVPDDFYITIERGKELDLETSISLDREITAPIEVSSEVGKLKVLYDDEVVGFSPLVLDRNIEKASIISLAFRLVQSLARSVH
ncbi:MAG TPA: D-alanyl-D-alanine carboxypeptidase [Natronincola sp.]|nr:D-alanyl-D-alanine carboxypeptidase [Natronincola sp.]